MRRLWSLFVQVMIEFVKSVFIDFAADSMMVPWIYLCFNKEFSSNRNSDGSSGAGLGTSGVDASATADKSKKASMSFNSSKMGAGGLGTSTNINKSNMGLLNANDANQYNSGINESGLDIENEFGYATDEDSVFQEFFQKDDDREIRRLGKKVSHSSDIGATKKQVKQLIKRYTEQTKTYEFLVKFNVQVEPTDNSSVASVLNGSQVEAAAQIPPEVLE